MTINITGPVRQPDGSLFINSIITIQRMGGVVSQSSSVLLPDEFTVMTDGIGEVDFEIEAGQYQAYTDGQRERRIRWDFNVPETPASRTFESCVEAATPTITPDLVLQAEAAADRAEAIGTFDSRAELVAWRAGNAPENGRSYFFSGTALVGATGSAILPSLADLRPVGNVADAALLDVVTGTVSDAVALTNAQRINAWLAEADCNVFNWRTDEIGIGETIRLGRDGNGVVGVPGAQVFGISTVGARAKWQGAAGGTMFLARSLSTVVDLHSPYMYGFSADGNAVAGIGVEFSGVMKPMADALHVSNVRDNAGSYAYIFRHNPDATGTQVNCCYGGKFGSLTCAINWAANGFLFSGKPLSSGTNVTFCQFDYCHVTLRNGFSFVFQKGDDNVITQIGVSRAAGGTGGKILFDTGPAVSKVWVGNKIHNMNLSKTDGAAIEIQMSGTEARGNYIGYNGVDSEPSIIYTGGAAEGDNDWDFLGRSNYAGGWVSRPFRSFYLPNVNSTDPRRLDWYEEGTGTSGISFGGASVGITYASQTLNWTRIGNICHVNGSVVLTSKGSSVGNAAITGLPFGTFAVASSFTFGYYQDFAVALTPSGFASASTISLRKMGGVTASPMTNTDFGNTTRIDFAGFYQVA